MHGWSAEANFEDELETWVISINDTNDAAPAAGPEFVVGEEGNSELARNFTIALVDLWNREYGNCSTVPGVLEKSQETPEEDDAENYTWQDWIAYFRYFPEIELVGYSAGLVEVRNRALMKKYDLDWSEVHKIMPAIRASRYHPSYSGNPGRQEWEGCKDWTEALVKAGGYTSKSAAREKD